MKTILITGASEGLGKEIAKVLSRENNVVIISNNEEKLRKAALEVKAKSFYVCDIRDFKNIDKVFNEVIKKYKKIDCLINNAGIWLQGNFEENSYEEVKNVLDVNLFGTIACAKAIIPHMKKRKSGQIINIASNIAIEPEAFAPIYSISKQAVETYRRCVQNDLASNGIYMTNFCPGLMPTQIFKKAGNHIPEDVMQKCGLDLKLAALEVKSIIDSFGKIWKPTVQVKNPNDIGIS